MFSDKLAKLSTGSWKVKLCQCNILNRINQTFKTLLKNQQYIINAYILCLSIIFLLRLIIDQQQSYDNNNLFINLFVGIFGLAYSVLGKICSSFNTGKYKNIIKLYLDVSLLILSVLIFEQFCLNHKFWTGTITLTNYIFFVLNHSFHYNKLFLSICFLYQIIRYQIAFQFDQDELLVSIMVLTFISLLIFSKNVYESQIKDIQQLNNMRSAQTLQIDPSDKFNQSPISNSHLKFNRIQSLNKIKSINELGNNNQYLYKAYKQNNQFLTTSTITKNNQKLVSPNRSKISKQQLENSQLLPAILDQSNINPSQPSIQLKVQEPIPIQNQSDSFFTEAIPLPLIQQKSEKENLRQFFLEILDILPQGIAIINAKNELIYSNNYMSELLGCKNQQDIPLILLNLSTDQKNNYAQSFYQSNTIMNNTLFKLYGEDEEEKVFQNNQNSEFKPFDDFKQDNVQIRKSKFIIEDDDQSQGKIQKDSIKVKTLLQKVFQLNESKSPTQNNYPGQGIKDGFEIKIQKQQTSQDQKIQPCIGLNKTSSNQKKNNQTSTAVSSNQSKMQCQNTIIAQDELNNKGQKSSDESHKSLLEQLNNGNQLGYFQYNNDTAMMLVNYNQQNLILRMRPFEFLIAQENNETALLVAIEPLWEEFFQSIKAELNQAKMKMFGSMCHELRTPLNCSISMLEVLSNKLKGSHLLNEFMRPALCSNKLMLNLVNDILDFVQMDSGKFKFTFVEFNLESLLKECLVLISMQAKLKNLSLELRIDDDVPNTLKSDPNRIRQIILNFLSNSLKFTTQGKISIECKMSKEEQRHVKNVIILSVSDSGIGISQENQRNIFQLFNKVDLKDKQCLNSTGCGIGLALSNSLAKQLGPESGSGIKVESTVGQGSTFFFKLQDFSETIIERNKTQQTQQSIVIADDQYLESCDIKSNTMEDYIAENDIKPRIFYPKLKFFENAINLIQGTETHQQNEEVFKLSQSIFQQQQTLQQQFSLQQQHSQTSFFLKDSLQAKQIKQRIITDFEIEEHSYCTDYSYSYVNQESPTHITNKQIQQNKLKILKNMESLCNCSKVLIVDDDQFNIYALGKQLETFQIKFDTASNGLIAVNKIQDLLQNGQCCKSYKLIFMDIEMPIKNGLQASYEIKELHQNYQVSMPFIVACTGYNEGIINSQEAQKAGIKDFLTKPILKNALEVLLYTWVINK